MKQLMQQYADSIQSANTSGWTWGQVDTGTNTAKLPNGTVIPVTIRGRPGNYAPIYLFGDGTGLVDVPEGVQVQSDGQVIGNVYTVIVEQYQQYPSSTYRNQVQTITGFGTFTSARYFFNAVGCKSLVVYNNLTGDSHEINPSLYSNFTDLQASYSCISDLSFSFTTVETFNGQVPPAQGLATGSSEYSSADAFIYSGPLVVIGAEGKDILIYQQSTISLSYSFAATYPGPLSFLLRQQG